MFEKPTCEGLEQKVRRFEQAEAVYKLERIISKASRQFLALTDLDKSINTCLAEIGHFCGAGRAYLFQFTSDGSIMNNTHEWCAPGVRPEIERLQGLSTDMFPWWMKILKAGGDIHVKIVAEMSSEARAEKEMLEAQNIKSVLVAPFLVENRLAGFLGLDNITSLKVWDERELVPLRTLAEIIGTAVTRRRAEEALRHNEELLQLFVKHTPAAVAMCDRQMRYLSYSDRWAQDYGLGDESFIGRCHYDLFPDLPAHWKKEHQRCFDGEVIEKDEEPFPRKDGSPQRCIKFESFTTL